MEHVQRLELLGGALVLRALARGDEAELVRIHREPEVARWWDQPEPAFPWDEPSSQRLTIVYEGAVAGLIQYWEEPEPKYRHAGIDVFVDPRLHARGIGSAAVAGLSRALIQTRGHHRVTVDPAVGNRAAVRAYEKAGFVPVGVMRLSERDADGQGWHDSVLMELVVEDRTL
jgi:aminoglycoside 6'-N-acetyltransferase